MPDSLSLRRPKGFSQIALGSLSAWFVGAGRWDHVGLSENEAQDFLCHFFRCLQGVHKDALRATCLSLQKTFMAMRRDTFEAIQSEPPFSRCARRNMKELLVAWLAGETAFAETWSAAFGPGWEENISPEQPVRMIPGSGESADNAVQMLTDDPEDKVAAEYWYLYYQFGQSWQCERQAVTLLDANGRRYDILQVRFSDGERKEIYFLL